MPVAKFSRKAAGITEVILSIFDMCGILKILSVGYTTIK